MCYNLFGNLGISNKTASRVVSTYSFMISWLMLVLVFIMAVDNQTKGSTINNFTFYILLLMTNVKTYRTVKLLKIGFFLGVLIFIELFI